MLSGLGPTRIGKAHRAGRTCEPGRPRIERVDASSLRSLVPPSRACLTLYVRMGQCAALLGCIWRLSVPRKNI
jgi:hypothetical protein